ncbi:MAG: DNA repair protein RecO [Sphaerochaetaceae bacterium]|jgi:DNA repair protein RecO (recombination protein O)|nr:DNA repair protein RecO [Sphaerochaetaceae bacterium]HHU89299.1 DNA repair protein RecO [Spirochaetales bacterium]
MEKNLTCQAIVLANKKWGDLHRLVTLLSPTLGLFDAVVYGGRKGKLAGGIEPFSRGTFYLYSNRPKKGYTLKDVDLIAGDGTIKGEIERLYIAHALCEIVIRMHGGDYGELFHLTTAAISLLDDPAIEAKRVLILFITRFIKIMGLEGDLNQCPQCGREYQGEESLSFNRTLNSPCCHSCGDVGGEVAWTLGPGARRYLLYIHPLEEREAVLVPLSETATIRLVRYMLRYLTTILGSPLKSLNTALLWEV